MSLFVPGMRAGEPHLESTSWNSGRFHLPFECPSAPQGQKEKGREVESKPLAVQEHHFCQESGWEIEEAASAIHAPE